MTALLPLHSVGLRFPLNTPGFLIPVKCLRNCFCNCFLHYTVPMRFSDSPHSVLPTLCVISIWKPLLFVNIIISLWWLSKHNFQNVKNIIERTRQWAWAYAKILFNSLMREPVELKIEILYGQWRMVLRLDHWIWFRLDYILQNKKTMTVEVISSDRRKPNHWFKFSTT